AVDCENRHPLANLDDGVTDVVGLQPDLFIFQVGSDLAEAELVEPADLEDLIDRRSGRNAVDICGGLLPLEAVDLDGDANVFPLAGAVVGEVDGTLQRLVL